MYGRPPAQRSVVQHESERVAFQLDSAQGQDPTTARFSFYVGGRGAGKSYAGALRAIMATQAQPGSLGLVGAPTHPMLRDAAQSTGLPGRYSLYQICHRASSAGCVIVRWSASWKR